METNTTTTTGDAMKKTERPTLADLNASSVIGDRPWGGDYRTNEAGELVMDKPIYTLHHEYAIGQAGAGRTGQLVHLLTLQRVIVEHREHKPGTFKVGDVFSSHARCGTRSNGQNTVGRIYSQLNTDALTCTKCIAWLDGGKTKGGQ